MGLTEAELSYITPRAFTNKLKGFKTLQDREEFRQKELVYTILSPHIAKDSDRKKLFKEIFEPEDKKPRSKPKKDARELAAEIDRILDGQVPKPPAEKKA